VYTFEEIQFFHKQEGKPVPVRFEELSRHCGEARRTLLSDPAGIRGFCRISYGFEAQMEE
jgi:hypothetical protein